ncbi:hypothetical protein RclHR1_24940002 [Rhizophagus clarus]|uniref:Galactose oxidase n=1 Tax=Rhizophagus clarus TaxID=94130 RepID=A0A2Z6RE16_9GLOM|nr:hypothetical protein RclHR1_24940002 [Rhizophagus clarus]GET01599.1 hypothetical protein GLOIN_2v1843891 [Rhizophagus clarus]
MIQKYITLLFIFQLLIEINCQYVQKQREGHTATFIDNKLYILGGLSPNNVGKDFFYFDFSVPFNTQNLLLRDLSNINTVPSHFGAGSARGGVNNDTLFLCGEVGNTATATIVYKFNVQSNSWNTPITTGIKPTLYDASIGTIDHNGKMYFWEGIGSIIAILDTKNLIWEERSSIGAPNIGLKSAATLLPDNKIIYMDSSVDNLTQVYLYDTINDNWSTKTTSGTVPPKKLGASAVLGLDGQRVIVYGGTTDPLNSLYELNLLNFEWRIPKTSGKTPASRTSHRANVVGKYMVVSFGLGYNQSDENDILLLDISNNDEYIWTNEYDPTPTISPLSTMPFHKSSSNISITGAIVGSLIVCALIILLLYLWNKNSCRNNKARNNTSLNNQGISGSPNIEIHNHGREAEPLDNEIVHNHGRETIELPVYNHGRE